MFAVGGVELIALLSGGPLVDATTSAQVNQLVGHGPAWQASGVERGDQIDALDARLLREFAAAPRVGVLELSRRLGVARATVQSRLDRL
ncbi:MAG TPA: AsnC family protein, partial [Jatrophihabitantaceae bacterium]|nr:AsnC family protein [Jatrophihabitantaceae bacterium]